MQLRLLGGLTPNAFLRRHWQKRALFVRGALPDLKFHVTTRELLELARRDDVESRMVERRGKRWDTAHGPFASPRARRRDWTILVSGVNLHVPEADRLLRRFAFIPQARLDDVMVSYATPGGGVGPHVDSYDVFLVQGSGRRRWTVWEPSRETVRETYECGPGDLLYLPPGIRHDGVALEPCFTYSIGFRAPRGAELGAAFLDWLHERGLPDARYRDPALAPTRRPAAVPVEMVTFAEKHLRRIRWNRTDVEAFLGEYLSLPKPHVVFRPHPASGDTVHLDLKTQLLYGGKRFFINGEAFTVAARSAAALRTLADERKAARRTLARAGLKGLISEWQRRGYIWIKND